MDLKEIKKKPAVSVLVEWKARERTDKTKNALAARMKQFKRKVKRDFVDAYKATFFVGGNDLEQFQLTSVPTALEVDGILDKVFEQIAVEHARQPEDAVQEQAYDDLREDEEIFLNDHVRERQVERLLDDVADHVG